jgi:NAD(P)-dependent dehydrogenase (short-subunit alcohol dehydrogenase family)
MTATFHDLKNASVFITGGGSGIGAALTEGFLSQGARVAFIGRSDASAFVDDVAARTGNRPLFVQGDITETGILRTALARAAEAHGPVTVLVNNAADDVRHITEDMTEDLWDRLQAINLRAYFFACQAVIAGMRAAGGGAIVNFSSISYMMGNAGYPAYIAANAGITGLTRGLAREFGPDRIRVNALAPGWVLTGKQLEMWADEASLAAHLDRQCLKDHLKPEDVVQATLFLASDASRMMTGQAMVVDGGVVTTG